MPDPAADRQIKRKSGIRADGVIFQERKGIEKMKKILIVDDEPQILKSLTRIFFDTDYQVFTAESGEEALEFLESTMVDLVISDMRMPLMDGYELLKRVKEKYPQTIRMILSGYADEAAIFKATLRNITKFYFLKPWSNDQLLQYIEQMFETEDLLKSNDLLQLINNTEKLPTIESSYQKIIRMIDQDEDTAFISSEVEKDFAISSKILQIANSAFYGVKTGSVKHATIYLGRQNLKSLIYSTSIINSGNASYQERKYASLLWEHAQLTNKILHFIYDVFLNKKIPETAYSAGLLHNIGTVVFIQNSFEKYLNCIKKASGETEENKNLLKLEAQEFHVTHQETGGYLVSWWELPFPIVEAALFHHRPLSSSIINKEVVSSVHIAQHFAWRILHEPALTEFFPETYEQLGISSETFEKAVLEKCWD